MMINNAMNSALSGMQAASAMLYVAASNIANLNSSGNKSTQVAADSLPYADEESNDSVLTDPYQDSYDASVDPSGENDFTGELTNDMVQVSTAQNLYDANAAVISVSNRMIGSLLDVFSDGSQGDPNR